MARETYAEKVAIVTGGASGIGKALGIELARRGAEVVLADRQHAAAEEVAAAIRADGGKATAVELDVRSHAAFKALADRTLARTGRIDYLFNNAGIGVGGEVGDYKLEDWTDVIDVNLLGVVHGIQAVYPAMIAQGSGHICNTASVAGLVASGATGSYAATKHAVVGLSKTLRIEAQRHGVRVSVLCPGAIRTPILTGGKYGRINMPGATAENVMKQWERVRPIDPAELARGTLDAMAKNRAYIVLPRWWRVFWWLERMAPTLSLRFAAYLHERLRTEVAADAPAPEPAHQRSNVKPATDSRVN
jgi:NAD(P)-dependent dehydrogenase (short-subunit alcohol dehydrogenase family)